MKTCSLLIGMVILFAGSSYAEIDPETIVGLWLFDEVQGDTAKDSSANDLKSELVGDLKWVEGKFGSALEFGATPDDWVKVAHDDKLNLETWSVLGWVKMPDLISTSGAIIARNGDGANRSYVVVVRQAGHANKGSIHHSVESSRPGAFCRIPGPPSTPEPRREGTRPARSGPGYVGAARGDAHTRTHAGPWPAFPPGASGRSGW